MPKSQRKKKSKRFEKRPKIEKVEKCLNIFVQKIMKKIRKLKNI